MVSSRDEGGQMGAKLHKPEDAVAKLQQMDVLVSHS